MLSSIVGQEQAVRLLQQAVKTQKIAPAYLFVGMAGIGKSLAASGFASQLLATDSPKSHPDLLWVEPTYSDRGNLITLSQAEADNIKKKAAPKIRIEQVRQISQFLLRRPLKSDRLIVIVEDAQLMAESPANALLKTLEEPGRGIIILLAPTLESLLPTIVSRCQVVRFTPLSEAQLHQVLTQEGYEKAKQNHSLISMAQGSPGTAISAFQQLETLEPELLTQLTSLPNNLLSALMLAKKIAQLELPTQLWLTDYLQHYYWQQQQSIVRVKLCEESRKYLSSYVQPRLVWENLLLASCQ